MITPVQKNYLTKKNEIFLKKISKSLLLFILIIYNTDLFSQHQIAAGEAHSIFVCADGTVRASGNNDYGQLGDNSNTERHTSVLVGTMTSVVGVSAGKRHSLSVASNGSVWAWGDNTYGQLGDNSYSQKNFPQQVLGLTSIILIATGSNTNYALKSDGTVWTWGDNSFGQLGDNTLVNKNNAIMINSLSNIKGIAGGIDFGMALRIDGTVWTWGKNNYGQLGDNTTINRYTPVQVVGLTNVKSIVSNGNSAYALKTDGTVWAWGDNSKGQLGDNTTTQRLTPVKVTGLSNIFTISAGTNYGLAIKGDGTGWGWGDNSYGQLGDGTTIQRNVPVPVGSNINMLTELVGAINGYHTIALLNDKTVRDWGLNANGQLGNNSTSNVVSSPLIPVGMCPMGHPLTVSIVGKTDVNCKGEKTGTATVYVTGGALPLTYAWSPYGGNAATATNLGAGTYTCNVIDNDSKTGSYTVTIDQPSTEITFTASQQNLKCNGISTGSASVSSSGGTGTHNYTWTPNVSNSSSASGLATGTYTCTITDLNNCIKESVFIITQPPVLALTSSHKDALCNGSSDGAVTAIPSGGTNGYSYSWSPGGAITAVYAGLQAGTYTCTVTDANNCTATTTATVTQPKPLITNFTSNNVKCHGALTGSANVTAQDGTPNYSFSWQPAGGNNAAATGLAAGTYVCTVTDSHNCQTLQTVVITEPDALLVGGTSKNLSCKANGTGSATVSVTGGVANYNYQWSPSGGNAANASSLSAGNYVCTITDANNCVITKSFTILEPDKLAATSIQQDVLCNGMQTGSATVSVTGGTAGFNYSWSPSGGNSSTANNLSAGSYVCNISDANNCTTSISVNISQPALLTAIHNQTDVKCYGASTGLINVMPSGGIPGYQYTWSPSVGNGPIVSVLPAGTYTCVIKDNNNCSLVQTYTITQVPALAIQGQNVAVCFGDSSHLAVSVNGGNPPYQYNWSNSNSTSPAMGALHNTTTNVTVTITDKENCVATKTLLSVVNPLPIVELSADATNGVFLYDDVSKLLCLYDNTAQAKKWNWVFDGGQKSQDRNPCFVVSHNGEYCAEVMVTDQNTCSNKGKICILVEIPDIIVPNIFTPNEDGVNDVFSITTIGYADLTCRIFDRWGKPIYQWQGLAGGWNGKHSNGDALVDGTYYCVVELTNLKGEKRKKWGSIQLMR